MLALGLRDGGELAMVFTRLPALESSAFLGFIFPGEIAVLLCDVAASRGNPPLAGVMAAGIGGAVTGDAVGYLVGRRWGRRILGSTLGRFVDAEHLDRAERALARRGGGPVFLGRFTVALRVMIPGLAGMARMPDRRFEIANVTGGASWGANPVADGLDPPLSTATQQYLGRDYVEQVSFGARHVWERQDDTTR